MSFFAFPLAVQGSASTAVTVDMLVVFALIVLALVLFATEVVPIDVTAILVMVLLMVLGPWTQISPREGISGFASPATITVLAMLILSTGVSRTGIVQLVGQKMTEFAGSDQRKQLAATIGVTGPASGFINNTPSSRASTSFMVIVPTSSKGSKCTTACRSSTIQVTS